jgi:hypothetical protein
MSTRTDDNARKALGRYFASLQYHGYDAHDFEVDAYNWTASWEAANGDIVTIDLECGTITRSKW